jgi:hypothetical protein
MLNFSPDRIVPVPLSVTTEISLGSLVKEKRWGKRAWFSITMVQREAFLWKTLPKSTEGGLKEIAFTENTHRRENLTGSTWLEPVTLTGIFIVNSSYSSLGAISSF